MDADLDDAVVLGVAQGRAFAGGADRHQPSRPALDLPLDVGAQRLLVETSFAEGRDERRERASQTRTGHGGAPFPFPAAWPFAAGLWQNRHRGWNAAAQTADALPPGTASVSIPVMWSPAQ
jgi:hypothetical protein